MTDKDGKKIKVGSIVAIKKAGATNFTVKGKVIEICETYIVMVDRRTGGRWTVEMANFKRMSYNPPKKRRWEGEF